MKILVVVVAIGSGWLAAMAATESLQAQQSRPWIAMLQSDAPLFERAQACRRLAVVGGDEAVPALAALLSDPALSHYAREALEAIPHPAAGEALCGALRTLEGSLLVGVVNSLGMRREPDAAGALAPLVTEADSQVATAALLALGRIGGPEAIRVLQHALGGGRDDLRDPAAEGCLLVAARHLADGRRDDATGLYDAVRGAPVAAQLRATATRGAIVARGAAGRTLLVEQLHATEISMRDAALASIRELPDPPVTAILVAELETAEPDLQALLIPALADRESGQVLAAIEAKARAPSEEVRVAAVQALGRIGRNSSLPLLLQATRAPSNRETAAAFASLARINAPDTQAEILQILPATAPALRARLIAVIGERNARGAGAALLELAQNPDTETSKASLRALAAAARPDDLPELIRMAVAMPDEERKTLAARAIATTAMRVPEVGRRVDAVLSQLRQATNENARISLLLPLGAIVRSIGGSAEALPVITSMLTDNSERVRDAALRTLADWPSAAPGMTLLEVATRRDATPVQREIGLRGATRMAANVAAGRDRTPLDALAVFKTVNGIVRSQAEKLMLVSGLASLERIEAVQMLQTYLDDPTVHTEAALAVVKIAPALLASEQGGAVRQLLERIAASEKDEDTRRKAAQAAKKTGQIRAAK
ncbi:MAG: HEAT repeat domain-containing protein [Opitutaceae bacterium]|nr:HEAT repeat domain-containing protein [Opitutaceae bacterium]